MLKFFQWNIPWSLISYDASYKEVYRILKFVLINRWQKYFNIYEHNCKRNLLLPIDIIILDRYYTKNNQDNKLEK